MEDAATLFASFIDKRKARYTAQVLEVFEKRLETPLGRRGVLEEPEIRAAVAEVKAIIRSKLRELADDATEMMPFTEFRTNAAATEMTSPLRAAGADTRE